MEFCIEPQLPPVIQSCLNTRTATPSNIQSKRLGEVVYDRHELSCALKDFTERAQNAECNFSSVKGQKMSFVKKWNFRMKLFRSSGRIERPHIIAQKAGTSAG